MTNKLDWKEYKGEELKGAYWVVVAKWDVDRFLEPQIMLCIINHLDFYAHHAASVRLGEVEIVDIHHDDQLIAYAKLEVPEMPDDIIEKWKAEEAQE